MRLARALATDGGPPRDDLRHIADNSLFLAGFFGDSLQRRMVDLDYYISLGATPTRAWPATTTRLRMSLANWRRNSCP